MEKYNEIYKRYRPRVWRGLIGQQKQVKSIQKAILEEKTPTAYLFSGPRGCGKTSAALLTAKAINCLDLNPNTADPCNKCEVCVSIDNGTQMGVTYISAGNIRGVEEMRELVTQARMQSPIKKQVFIIDEIHNLSSGKGFEALLIPLEENDMPALFILCTTEPGKIPDTIISRTQGRRFNLVSPKEMTSYVHKIVEKEGLEIDEETLSSVIRAGKGSVRDTLTKLEEVTFGGELSPTFGGGLLEAISEKDIPKAWGVIAEADSNGIDSRLLGEQLFGDLRDLSLLAKSPNSTLVQEPPVQNVKQVINGLLGVPGILKVADQIGDGLSRSVYGGDARTHLEISVAKAVRVLEVAEKRKAK